MKQCICIKVNELRALRKEEAANTRDNAEEFLISVADVFEDKGAFSTRASAAAVVHLGTKVYETLAKAKRSEGEKSKEIHIMTAIMICMYLCKKPQDEDFCKETAEDLGDILARLRQVVRERFPEFGDGESLSSIVVPVLPVRVESTTLLQSSIGPPPVPKKGASAASGPMMMNLST